MVGELLVQCIDAVLAAGAADYPMAKFNELTAQVLSQTAGAARHQNHFLLASIVLVADGVGTQVVLYDAETAL